MIIKPMKSQCQSKGKGFALLGKRGDSNYRVLIFINLSICCTFAVTISKVFKPWMMSIKMTKKSLESRVKGIPRGTQIVLFNRRAFLVKNHPEIADEWIAGNSLNELAEKYLPNDYEISQNIARNAVLYALRVLIPEEELTELGLEHKRNNACKKKGYKPKIKDPQMVALGKRGYQGGLVHIPSGDLSRRCVDMMRRKGIYPYEGDSRFVNAGLNGQQILYPMDEKDYILFLREQRNLTWNEVADAVNSWYNRYGRKPRTANSIRVSYQGWKKEIAE